ncbi:TPA: hypothetical protein DIC38_00585 [Candidatus Nomurabacteria bacterium]|nr:hypothetical protein [Candidatus Nomurabacteria bacterium]
MKNKNGTKHYLICEAPICNDDRNPNYKKEVIWSPYEKICTRKPYEKFQKIQIEINDLVKRNKFKNIDKSYTAEDLEDGHI